MEQKTASQAEKRLNADRRPIRIEGQPTHAGIVAAMRRAFDDVCPQKRDTEREFGDLLAKLD